MVDIVPHLLHKAVVTLLKDPRRLKVVAILLLIIKVVAAMEVAVVADMEVDSKVDTEVTKYKFNNKCVLHFNISCKRLEFAAQMEGGGSSKESVVHGRNIRTLHRDICREICIFIERETHTHTHSKYVEI